MFIRPEQVVLAAVGESAAAVKVTDVRYHGHDALVTVDAERAGPLRGAGTRRRPAAGAEVGLTVRGPVTAWPVTEGNF